MPVQRFHTPCTASLLPPSAPHSLTHYLICSSYVSARLPARHARPSLRLLTLSVPLANSALGSHTAVTRKIHLNWNM